jgi:hypothetical protein
MHRSKGARETECGYQARIKMIHRLHVDTRMECKKSMALLVFCGLAEDYNLAPDEVAHYLGIRQNVHSNFLTIYNRYMDRALRVVKSGKKLNPSTPYGKLYTKLGLTKNYIRLQGL